MGDSTHNNFDLDSLPEFCGENDGAFRSVIPQGYLVIYTNPQQAEYQHVRYGDPGRQGAWCPECNAPMLRIMDIDTRDPRLGLSHLPFPSLPLLYCFYCNMCLDTLYYRIEPSGAITILSTIIRETYDEPFERLPSHLPATPVRLRPLTADEQEFLIEGYKTMPLSWPASEPPPPFEYLYGYNEQIGGEPMASHWSDYEFACPCCHQPMPFLATFSSETPTGEAICGDENDIQLVYAFCDRCHVVGALHTCFM